MMLEVRDLHAFYGKSHILQGVDLSVDQGEIVSLLGRNGVGRSTACKTIMGLVPPVGNISFKGRSIAGLRPDQIAHLGVGYVPEDRQVFPDLTVRQNLELGLKRAGIVGRWKFEDVFSLFPNLGERQDNPAGVLSGGEQQMLTMCRTLLIVEHDMSVVFGLADRISVLVYGQVIASGTPEEIRGNPKVKEAYLGEEAA